MAFQTFLCNTVYLGRPLWVEYPQDAATFAMDDQFLLGESAALAHNAANLTFVTSLSLLVCLCHLFYVYEI